jgi:signal transduction histidine kinase
VVYLQRKPELDEGPFLKEERKLINALAREIAGYIERKQAEEERVALQEQLRHADRLATIGQLAAGVAHELNEPLGNILGFAQLASKTDQLPEQTLKDLNRIIDASLQAREIIKKLMIFARQMPTKRLPVDVNKLIEEGLYFFEMRCVKSGIDLQCVLNPQLPNVIGDQLALNQVLVNLVVNAIQAMPEGGTLIIRTSAVEDRVHIKVEDTGHGMSQETMKKIFIPFFTTKDVNEGTGLGLAVVHGIITSHGGKINVSSTPGKGSLFDVILPVPKNILEDEESQ